MNKKKVSDNKKTFLTLVSDSIKSTVLDQLIVVFSIVQYLT